MFKINNMSFTSVVLLSVFCMTSTNAAEEATQENKEIEGKEAEACLRVLGSDVLSEDTKIRVLQEFLHRGFALDTISLKEQEHGKPAWVAPICEAASRECWGVVKSLLDNGISVNQCDLSNWTPLHYAASQRDEEAIDLLISRGANRNALNSEGETPLQEYHNSCHEVSQDNNGEIVALLQ